MRSRLPRFWHSLSARLLILTILFVMVVEVLIYVPSIAQFRKAYLDQRIAAAQIAALAVEEVPNRRISPDLEKDLLYSAEVQAVVVLRGDAHMLVLRQDLPEGLTASYDMRSAGFWTLAGDAFQTLARRGEGSIQVRGASSTARFNWVEVVMRENFLYAAMIDYSGRILGVGILISLIAASLIYWVLHRLVARPMRSLTLNIAEFREQPEIADRALQPSGRRDEIGAVEEELARAQEEVRQSLHQKTRLANLGAAVSRINHDLRNILSTAQMSSDHLLQASDSELKSRGPRLVRSIDRAIALCERTLKYGKAEEPPPNKVEIELQPLVDEVGGALGGAGAAARLTNEVAPGTRIYGDPDQMYRVLLNLGLNAVEAMNGRGSIMVRAARENGADLIGVEDDGTGLPQKVKEHIFEPFARGRAGGTGLGLTIVRELVHSHGGEVVLERSDKSGTVFRLSLPVREGPGAGSK